MDYEVKCANCVFYQKEQNAPAEFGTCHRFPPTPIVLMQEQPPASSLMPDQQRPQISQTVNPFFPPVQPAMWCGEFDAGDDPSIETPDAPALDGNGGHAPDAYE